MERLRMAVGTGGLTAVTLILLVMQLPLGGLLRAF
jgi:hypothetical protein